MIGFAGGKSANLDPLYQAFRAGSKCDPYVKNAFDAGYTCHPHGWGMAFHDGANLHHFRTSLPAWEQDISLPPIAGEKVLAIFHSRLASDPTLNAPICSHPFIAAADTQVLLLAHNGGVEVDDTAAERMVDSEWALAQIVKAGGIEKALPYLKERTRPNSALNLLVLAVGRDKSTPPVVHCLNYHKAETPQRQAYYQMYTADYQGGRVVMSSTFKDLEIAGVTNIELAPFGELFQL
jgi:predicted glutamine amidotransferase